MTRSMVRYAIAAAMCAGMLLAPRGMVAQVAVGAEVGDTVRIEAPTLGSGIRGELAAVRGDTMFVRRYGATLAVPMSRVERVDVRRPRPAMGRVARGMAYGAPLGLAAGLLLGIAAHGGGNPDCADDCNLLPGIGAAAGLAMGTALGAVIGISSPMGRWERVYPRRGVALSLALKL